MARAVGAAEGMERYDAACKRVLSERQVLARIMCDYMREYAGCDPGLVAGECLEGEPLVGVDPVGRDGRVRLTESQDATAVEGAVYFDVRFDARLPGGEGSATVEIDVEAQRDLRVGYPLLRRAVYYCGRMLSRQGAAEVRSSRYDLVRKVFSVWICMGADAAHRGTVARFHLAQEDLVGCPEYARADYDLAEVIVVCLGEGAGDSGAMGMLEVLFCEGMPAAEKVRRLRDDYDMMVSEEFEGKVQDMCNLSESVYEHGIEKGIEQGRAQGIEQGRAQGIEQGAEQARVDIVGRVMRLHAITLGEALSLLGIPQAELGRYEALLAAQPS